MILPNGDGNDPPMPRDLKSDPALSSPPLSDAASGSHAAWDDALEDLESQTASARKAQEGGADEQTLTRSLKQVVFALRNVAETHDDVTVKQFFISKSEAFDASLTMEERNAVLDEVSVVSLAPYRFAASAVGSVQSAKERTAAATAAIANVGSSQVASSSRASMMPNEPPPGYFAETDWQQALRNLEAAIREVEEATNARDKARLAVAEPNMLRCMDLLAQGHPDFKVREFWKQKAYEYRVADSPKAKATILKGVTKIVGALLLTPFLIAGSMIFGVGLVVTGIGNALTGGLLTKGAKRLRLAAKERKGSMNVPFMKK